ncbi:hypothetical protein GOAMI_83_00040 [Gordonia amicalis NBRC 100051 = JCM 11271]|nr:hypothetical protein GOAMI_83_00040 [Gordonia amicalis NBRC 100051 = JCM 11271]
MAAPRKFDQENRERTVRMNHDRLAAAGGSKLAAREHVGGLPDINQATPRNWIERDTPVVKAARFPGEISQRAGLCLGWCCPNRNAPVVRICAQTPAQTEERVDQVECGGLGRIDEPSWTGWRPGLGRLRRGGDDLTVACLVLDRRAVADR